MLAGYNSPIITYHKEKDETMQNLVSIANPISMKKASHCPSQLAGTPLTKTEIKENTAPNSTDKMIIFFFWQLTIDQ